MSLLADAGLLRVVRTRSVRAIEERHYETARTLCIDVLNRPEDKQGVAVSNALAEAAAETASAHAANELCGIAGWAGTPCWAKG